LWFQEQETGIQEDYSYSKLDCFYEHIIGGQTHMRLPFAHGSFAEAPGFGCVR